MPSLKGTSDHWSTTYLPITKEVQGCIRSCATCLPLTLTHILPLFVGRWIEWMIIFWVNTIHGNDMKWHHISHLKTSFTCSLFRIVGSACCRSSARTCSPPHPLWSARPPENRWQAMTLIRYFVKDCNERPAIRPFFQHPIKNLEQMVSLVTFKQVSIFLLNTPAIELFSRIWTTE